MTSICLRSSVERASVSETGGPRFKSWRGHQTNKNAPQTENAGRFSHLGAALEDEVFFVAHVAPVFIVTLIVISIDQEALFGVADLDGKHALILDVDAPD